MKIKFPNRVKLDGKWYGALEEIEVTKKEAEKYLAAGAMPVAEYEFVEEEPKEKPKKAAKKEPKKKAAPKKEKKK